MIELDVNVDIGFYSLIQAITQYGTTCAIEESDVDDVTLESPMLNISGQITGCDDTVIRIQITNPPLADEISDNNNWWKFALDRTYSMRFEFPNDFLMLIYSIS